MASRPFRTVVWLVLKPGGVDRMTKRAPDTVRGEIAVKLTVVVPAGAFQSPTIERTVEVASVFDGTELEDIRLTRDVITEAEAEMIVARRVERMEQILRERGAEVTWPVPDAEEPGHGYHEAGDYP